MIEYYLKFLIAIIPKVILASLSVLPLAFGVWGALKRRKGSDQSQYINYLVASILTGTVTLYFLYDSLFGRALESSSTAALVFVVVPFYALIILLVSLGIGKLIIRVISKGMQKDSKHRYSGVINNLIFLPILVIAVLEVGVLKQSITTNDLSVAETARSANALRYLYNQAAKSGRDTFGIFLFMAQNKNAPSDILEKLSRSNYPQIRIFVVSNPNTDYSVLEKLARDDIEYVRKAAKKRLEQGN